MIINQNFLKSKLRTIALGTSYIKINPRTSSYQITEHAPIFPWTILKQQYMLTKSTCLKVKYKYLKLRTQLYLSFHFKKELNDIY